MTKDQAAQLRAKWKEQGDLLPLCEHLIKELTDLVSRDAGVPMGATIAVPVGRRLTSLWPKTLALQHHAP